MVTNGKRSVAVFVVSLVPCMLGLSQRPAVVERGPKDLQLHLDSGKSSFVLYEPVFLTCTLSNPTLSYIVSDFRGLSIMERQLKISVQEGSGNQVSYYSGAIADFAGVWHTEHAPGQLIIDTNRLFFNDLSRNLAFPRPGHYTIYGKIYLGNYPNPVFVEAEPVTIDVVDPKAVDEGVIEVFGSKERLVELLRTGAWTYCKGSSDDECLERLRVLMTEYRDSAYIPPIAFGVATVLGRHSSGRGGNYLVEAEILQEFLRRWPRHPLVPGATSALARALHKAGKSKEAMEWIDRFEKQYPGRESPRKLIEESSRNR